MTPLNGVALFVQQDVECQAKEAADEAKKKSKMDAVQLREHQHVLAAGTKVFANPHEGDTETRPLIYRDALKQG